MMHLEQLNQSNRHGKGFLCSVEVADILQERTREVVSFFLNYAKVVPTASLVSEDLFHTPTFSSAIVHASKPIFTA
jgi:hypothetical protein